MYNERELLYKETHEDFLMSDILTELAADDGDEDICHARTMGLDGEFTIYPSHLKAYMRKRTRSAGRRRPAWSGSAGSRRRRRPGAKRSPL